MLRASTRSRLRWRIGGRLFRRLSRPADERTRSGQRPAFGEGCGPAGERVRNRFAKCDEEVRSLTVTAEQHIKGRSSNISNKTRSVSQKTPLPAARPAISPTKRPISAAVRREQQELDRYREQNARYQQETCSLANRTSSTSKKTCNIVKPKKRIAKRLPGWSTGWHGLPPPAPGTPRVAGGRGAVRTGPAELASRGDAGAAGRSLPAVVPRGPGGIASRARRGASVFPAAES